MFQNSFTYVRIAVGTPERGGGAVAPKRKVVRVAIIDRDAHILTTNLPRPVGGASDVLLPNQNFHAVFAFT